MLNLSRAIVGYSGASSLKGFHAMIGLASCLRISRAERAAFMSNAVLSRFLLERFCEAGRIFVDVGSHIGSVIAGVRQNTSPSAIYAIEANPEKADFIRKTFRDCEVISCAAGPQAGEAAFFIPSNADGNSSLDLDFAARGGGDVRSIRVAMRRLDDIIPHTDVSVLKLDVEGGELGVLIGAELLIAKSRPIIFFESGAEQPEAYPRNDLFQWFLDHDYEVFIPSRISHLGGSCDLGTFNYSHNYPPLTIDYIAIPSDKRDDIRLRARALLGVV